MRVAGFGFRQDTTHTALKDALAKASAVSGGNSVSMLVTHERKSSHAALQALASELKLPVLAINAETLSKISVRTHSDRVAALYGTGSIAEAAALAAAGAGARLVGARVISDDGTAVAAIAEGVIP